MGKLCEKRNYPNAACKDVRYGSIVVVGSVAGVYGGEFRLASGGVEEIFPLKKKKDCFD